LGLTAGLGLIVAAPVRAQQSTTISNETDARKKITNVTARNRDAYLSGDAVTYARQFTNDRVLIAATGKVSRGREAIEHLLRTFSKA